MTVKLTWMGEQVKRRVGARLLERMRAAAKEVRDLVRKRVSIPYPPASKPGHYPHKLSGRFMRSIGYRTFAQKRRIEFYSRVPYAVYLEYGTRRMAPRPTFRRAVAEFGPMLAKVMSSTGGRIGRGFVTAVGALFGGGGLGAAAVRAAKRARSATRRKKAAKRKAKGKRR